MCNGVCGVLISHAAKIIAGYSARIITRDYVVGCDEVVTSSCFHILEWFYFYCVQAPLRKVMFVFKQPNFMNKF